jgi:hypothetical protein
MMSHGSPKLIVSNNVRSLPLRIRLRRGALKGRLNRIET